MTNPGRVLIVEDDTLIGLMLYDMFEALGYPEPALATNVSEAIEMIDAEAFSAVLIDVHLGSQKGWPIADELATRNIKFAFTTGGGTDIPHVYRDRPIIMKPFRLKDLEKAIENFK